MLHKNGKQPYGVFLIGSHALVAAKIILAKQFAHLSALLDLLPALAQPGQIHLALAAHVVLLKLGDAHSCHIVRLGNHPDLGLLHKKTNIQRDFKRLAITMPTAPAVLMSPHNPGMRLERNACALWLLLASAFDQS